MDECRTVVTILANNNKTKTFLKNLISIEIDRFIYQQQANEWGKKPSCSSKPLFIRWLNSAVKRWRNAAGLTPHGAQRESSKRRWQRRKYINSNGFATTFCRRKKKHLIHFYVLFGGSIEFRRQRAAPAKKKINHNEIRQRTLFMLWPLSTENMHKIDWRKKKEIECGLGTGKWSAPHVHVIAARMDSVCVWFAECICDRLVHSKLNGNFSFIGKAKNSNQIDPDRERFNGGFATTTPTATTTTNI